METNGFTIVDHIECVVAEVRLNGDYVCTANNEFVGNKVRVLCPVTEMENEELPLARAFCFVRGFYPEEQVMNMIHDGILVKVGLQSLPRFYFNFMCFIPHSCRISLLMINAAMHINYLCFTIKKEYIMIYEMTKPQLLKVAEGKKNAGSLYLKFIARNPENSMDKGEVTVNDEDWVADYAKYLEVAEADGVDNFGQPKFKESKLKDASKPLPESLLKLPNTQFEPYLTPGGEEYVAIDDNGNPRKNDRGNFITTKCLYVFTWMSIDNQDRTVKRYIKGWDPISRGESILKRFYKPLKEFTSPEPTGIVLPQGEDAPLINGESAPAV